MDHLDMSDIQPADLVSSRGTTLLGLYLVALGTALIYLTAVVWPPDFDVAAQRAGSTKDQKDVESPIVFVFPKIWAGDATKAEPRSPQPPHPEDKARVDFGAGSHVESEGSTTTISVAVSYDHRLLLLVIVVGALGSYIHVASSFGDFVGNRTFTRSWVWWYLLRPYVGVPLAVLFYFVVRAGFLTAGASAGDVNRFGIAAVAGLVGMFSVTAADKLKELFDTLFKTDVKRKDSLTSSVANTKNGKTESQESPVPTVSNIESDANVIRIFGSGFTDQSAILVNDDERPSSETTLISDAEVTVARHKEDKGQIVVEVSNPSPGGGRSGRKTINLES